MPVLMLAAATFAISSLSAQDANGALDAAMKRAGASQEPIVTTADRALIARKCGYAAGWNERNIKLNHGVLICENGKRVADGETKALETRISRRARAYANAVMSDPAVKRAIDMTASEAARKALEKVRKDFGS